MKFFIVFAVCVAVASARFVVPDVAAAEAQEIKDIIAAINHPSTDPATAALLQQMLDSILNVQDSPIDVGPVIVDEVEDSPIHVEPVIIDEVEDSPIHVEPVIIDESPINVEPVIIDGPVEGPSASSSPLVQIIINVKSGANANQPQPGPVINEEEAIEIPETPIIVVDEAEINEEEAIEIPETPVIVVDEPEIVEEPVVPEQVIVAPIVPVPVAVLPDTLN